MASTAAGDQIVDSMLAKLSEFVDSLPDGEREALVSLCQVGALTLAAADEDDDVDGFGFPNVKWTPVGGGQPVPIPYPNIGKKACLLFC